MKILLIHNYYRQRGGEDEYFDSLVKLLKDNGHHIILFTKKSKEIISFNQKIESIRSLFGFNYKINKQLSQLIKNEGPDIAHFHNIYPLIGPSAYLVCKENKIPIVQTIHNYRLLWPKGIFYSAGRSRFYSLFLSISIFFNIKKKIYNLIDHYIFPSRFTRDFYLKNALFKIKDHTIVPHFVNIKISTKPIKKSNYFLFAGRFSQEKGIIPLLQIFSKLPKNNLIVIGDGPQKKTVDSYKKYKNIEILNWLNKKLLYRYIQKSLAVIVPSLSFEVMPLTPIESNILGTTVIVPKTKVFQETIKNNVVFFKFGDFLDLKDKIIKLHNSKLKPKIDYYSYSPESHYSFLMSIYKNYI
ncbi:MAG: glycosyltransferase family 4 protein [Patescibacteria group bacterium]